jgi:creatinine amidohydrolase
MRFDQLRPDQVAHAHAASPIAYVPIGSIEYHGPHLPMGVDMVTATGVCERACRRTGGVVLPPSYLALGTLDLPWTLCFSAELVELWANEVIDQLNHRGFELVVLLTGHGPLDLLHLLKRVSRERSAAGRAAYAACYLEFNASGLTEPQRGEPTVIDHASTVETSWMLALQPECVELNALPDDPEAVPVGVYGRNPRFTASRAWGQQQANACGDVLVERVAAHRAGALDDLSDLRTFVRRCWPEPLELRPAGGGDIELHNPGRASRYITGITSATIAGTPLDVDGAWLRNDAPGEAGIAVAVQSLGRESGFYLRRGQTAVLSLPSLRQASRTAPTADAVLRMEIELAGVASAAVSACIGRGTPPIAATP